MDLTIHRGAAEIGGICIEVAHEGTRVIIDAGTPLVDRDHRPFKGDPTTMLPAAPGLFRDVGAADMQGQRSSDPERSNPHQSAQPPPDPASPPGPPSFPAALLLTHAHMDHYGLLPWVRHDVPVYAGHATRALVELTDRFIRPEYDPRRITPIAPRQPFSIGPITATAFQVDHSAIGAFAWLLEAGGRSVLYSGDLRAHGLDADLFEALLRDAPRGADALLLEGTHLMEAQTAFPSEAAVRQGFTDLASATPGMVVAFASGQNIDRIRVLHEAARQTGRILVIDIYVAHVLRMLAGLAPDGGVTTSGIPPLPSPEDDDVRIFYPYRLARLWAETGRRADLFGFPGRQIKRAEMRAKPGRYLMMARPSMWGDLSRLTLDGAALAWSMWSGYLNEPTARGIRTLSAARGLPIHHIHTSGHAFGPDLQRLANVLRPKRLVPIHTFDAGRFGEIFANVVMLKDEQKLSI